MKKILIVLTNIAMYGTTNRATGLWLGELTHFYDEVVAAGFEVDFVSPLGGYVTSVCHGVVGLLNLRDDAGNYLIAGRTVTGFTNGEETLNGTLKHMPYLTEDELKKRGANYVKKRPFADHAVQDGRLITGQNPFSPRSVAKLLVANLKQEN